MFLRQRVTLLLVAVCALGVASYAYAQTVAPMPDGGPMSNWLIQNLWAIVVCAFNIGLTWRQVADLQRRIVVLEKCTVEEIPETYARKDVLTEKLTGIDRELKNWRESFSFLLRRPDRRQHERNGE